MANETDDRPTIERGSYGDRGVLERNRPDGLGFPQGYEQTKPEPSTGGRGRPGYVPPLTGESGVGSQRVAPKK